MYVRKVADEIINAKICKVVIAFKIQASFLTLLRTVEHKCFIALLFLTGLLFNFLWLLFLVVIGGLPLTGLDCEIGA